MWAKGCMVAKTIAVAPAWLGNCHAGRSPARPCQQLASSFGVRQLAAAFAQASLLAVQRSAVL